MNLLATLVLILLVAIVAVAFVRMMGGGRGIYGAPGRAAPTERVVEREVERPAADSGRVVEREVERPPAEPSRVVEREVVERDVQDPPAI